LYGKVGIQAIIEYSKQNFNKPKTMAAQSAAIVFGILLCFS